MIISCDNCSVSLQLDESKIPNGNFTVRCPRCQNLIRVAPGANSTVQQLKENTPAPAVREGTNDFSAKESEFQINTALRSLLSALQTENKVLDADDEQSKKPRRVLLCLGERQDAAAKALVDAGLKLTWRKLRRRLTSGCAKAKPKSFFSPLISASEFGGAEILQQKVNAMHSSERRRLFLFRLKTTERRSTLKKRLCEIWI